MSLIERAVARLGGTHNAPAPAKGASPDSPLPGPRPVVGVSAASAGDDWVAPIAKSPHQGHVSRVPAARSFGTAIDLPLERLREQGFVTPAARGTATGLEFRSIKGPILEKAFGDEAQRVVNGQRVLVTSSVPGEGKTFCAINIAISAAIGGELSVLLLDADVARSSIAATFGIATGKGLIDALKGDVADPFALIRPTDIRGLHVLPAGSPRAHGGESLGSHAMGSLLDQLSAQLPDWLIVIDSPPLLAVMETRSLLQRVGQIVMVVAAGETPRKTVEAALAAAPGTKQVSLVLNKVPQSKNRFDYYYGY